MAVADRKSHTDVSLSKPADHTKWLHRIAALHDAQTCLLAKAAALVAESERICNLDATAYTQAATFTTRMKSHLSKDIRQECKTLEPLLNAFEKQLLAERQSNNDHFNLKQNLDTTHAIQYKLKEVMTDAEAILAQLKKLEDSDALFMSLKEQSTALLKKLDEEQRALDKTYSEIIKEMRETAPQYGIRQFELHQRILSIIQIQPDQITAAHNKIKHQLQLVNQIFENHVDQLDTLYAQDIHPLYEATRSPIIQRFVMPEMSADSKEQEVKSTTTASIKRMLNESRKINAWAKATCTPPLNYITKRVGVAYALANDVNSEQLSCRFGPIAYTAAGSFTGIVAATLLTAFAAAMTGGTVAALVIGIACLFLTYRLFKRALLQVEWDNDLYTGSNNCNSLYKRLARQDDALREKATPKFFTDGFLAWLCGESDKSKSERKFFRRQGVLLKSLNKDFFAKLETEAPAQAKRQTDSDPAIILKKTYLSHIDLAYKTDSQTMFFKRTPECKSDEIRINNVDAYNAAVSARVYRG